MIFSKRTVYAATCVGAMMLMMDAAQTASAQGLRSQILLNHVPSGVHESTQAGPVAETANLNLSIGLPLRNAAQLDALVQQIADPRSPNYRQYLSASDFADRFGPTQQDYDKLTAFAEANGFTVSGKHANRMILDVTGSAGVVNKAFHINLTSFDHPTRGRFYAPDRDPSLDSDVQVLDVSGLDNFTVPAPMDLKLKPLTTAIPLVSGSGPSGLYIGKDFRAAYAPGVTLTGAGQTIGLVEFDGFYAADVTSNFSKAGLPPVPVSTVLLDGSNGIPGGSNIEVILDIVMAGYMAPGANVVVYEGNTPNDVLNRMATDNTAKQLSCSWGYGINSTTEQIFKQMIAQGQSFFTASGDSGAYSGSIMPPADDPNVTSVGGTALATASAGGAWQSESAWSGSGGGISTTYPIPSYQQSMNMAAQGGSNTMRNMPDVALTGAVQMYLIFNNGQQTAVGGTSAATPLWGGFTALANQQAAASQKPALGFMNPALYAIGNNASSYAAAMHDITTGNTGFAAIPGYDLTTGWGSPNGQALINDLVSVPSTPAFTLSAAPSSASVLSGSTTTSTIQMNAQNGFSAAVTLSATGLPSGVTATFGAFNASHASVMTLTASASAAAGSSTVTVAGKSGTLSSTVTIALTVAPPALFSLAAASPTLSVVQAASAASTITVAPKNGFSGKVALTISGLPTGVTASFSPASTSTTSALTLSATSAATVGTSTVTVTGTSGASSTTVALSLTVKAGPSFTLTAAPASLSVVAGGSGTSTISVTPLNGFTGTAALAVTGLPAGVTATFTGSALKLAASTSAAAGSSTVTITGTSGNVSAQTSIALTVVATTGFKLSSVSNVNVAASGTGTAVITVAPLAGFNGTVALTASGLPAGVSASFSPASTTTTSTLTLTAASGTVAKVSQFTVTGVSGSLTSAVAMTVTVAPPADFSATLAPASLRIVKGGKGTTAINLTPINGFSGGVMLAATGLPAGVTAGFATPNGGVLALFTVSNNAVAGTSQVNVIATSATAAGSLTHTAILTLTVVAPNAATAAVDLSPSYNVSGIAVDNLPFTGGGLDAGGRSYSGILLGASQTVASTGTLFSMGPMGLPDAVTSQTVALTSGEFTSLQMVATGVNGNQPAQKFTVTYTDGTTTVFTQSMSDWFTPQNYAGETKAVPVSYRDNSTGTTDGEPFYLYSYSFSLNSAKTVRSVTLPQNRNVVVMAITLGGQH